MRSYMIVVYGKGKVGNGLHALLTHVDIEHVLMDDADRDDKLLQDAEYIIVSPGIKPLHSIYFLYQKKILSELSYLGLLIKRLSLPTITFIGITGTNGKSTTSRVMYQALQKLFPQSKIWLTGNFDIPLSSTLLSILQEGKLQDHICVIEVSSFMLYRLQNFIFDYGIWLNIARDHLDWHETMQDYISSKHRICIQSTVCYVSHTLYVLIDQSILQRVKKIPDTFDISYTKFLGKHNMKNISAVVSCLIDMCQKRGISFSPEQVFADIQPLPHRLQLIKQIGDIGIIDDGISTSAQSLLAALDAMEEKCVLIVGGYDKGDDYTILNHILYAKVAYAVCLGENKYKIAEVLKAVGVSYILSDTLDHAIHTAIDAAKRMSISIVLFSPGAASFDMFANVYDRVEQFNQIISALDIE